MLREFLSEKAYECFGSPPAVEYTSRRPAGDGQKRPLRTMPYQLPLDERDCLVDLGRQIGVSRKADDVFEYDGPLQHEVLKLSFSCEHSFAKE